MNETKRVWISYTKLVGDVSRLDELLVINPENFLCYSESCYLNEQPYSIYDVCPYIEANSEHSTIATTIKLQ